jgi:hypothetical protein
VLAGQRLSVNGVGASAHCAGAVDDGWPDHVSDAVAILHTLREPDQTMAQVGDPAIWRAMVMAALQTA